MSSHNTFIVYISGKVFYEVKVHLYEQCVIAVLSAHIPIHCIYLGRFYVRSEVIHKSPPDYFVGKLVLHGKILREVKGNTINRPLIIVLVNQYYMGRFYVRTLTLRKIFPYKVTTGNTLHVM